MSDTCESVRPSAPETEARPKPLPPSGNFLGMDLEMSQPGGEVVQIGAGVMHLPTGELLERLNVYVQIGKPMDYRTMLLTGIDDDILLREGGTLLEGYHALVSLHRRHRCFINGIEWGNDFRYLRERLGDEIKDEGWAFGRRTVDVKTLYVEWRRANNENTKSGLSKSMAKGGLQFLGRKHHADDDAVNTLRRWRRMLELLRRDPTQSFPPANTTGQK